ncbi:MAG TPA: TIGR00725 family protein [Coriobacteriia bacterium]|nr:TIGR00725 family protein [Coriobacteriia bacterium]
MRTVIGVMGGGVADEATRALARRTGELVAAQGWALLTGGRPAGVMDAASAGAKRAGGLVLAVLPGEEPDEATSHADVVICTGMGDARNVVNVLSSHVVLALPGGAGTLSEIALAVNACRPVVVVGWHPGDALVQVGGERMALASSPEEAVEAAKRFLSGARLGAESAATVRGRARRSGSATR